MSYRYEDFRDYVESPGAQQQVLRVLDHARTTLKESGCAFLGRIMRPADGDTYQQAAIVDRLIELGWLAEMPGVRAPAYLYRIVVLPGEFSR